MKRAKIIAVDFDGTLVTDAFPAIGEPIFKTIIRLKAEQEKGARVILWTCRVDDKLEEAIYFCHRYDIYLDAVNENLTEIKNIFVKESRKIFADEYWDDRSVFLDHIKHPDILEFDTDCQLPWIKANPNLRKLRYTDDDLKRMWADGYMESSGVKKTMSSDFKISCIADGNNSKDLNTVLNLVYGVSSVNHGNWIPVTERLPEKPLYDWVLVQCEMVRGGHYGVPHIAEYRNGVWFADCYDTPLDSTAGVRVTHWRPLPAKPEAIVRDKKQRSDFDTSGIPDGP